MPLPTPLPVAVFFSQFLPGGTEGQMIELATRLDRSRFEVHLACLHRNGAWLPRVSPNVDAVAEFPIQSFRHPGTILRMRQFAAWCRNRRIAIVHATDLYSNVFALPAAAAAGVPVRIGSRREINPDKGYGLVALQRVSYAFAHRIVANSNAAAARLRRESVRDGAIRVIPNGVDLSVYRPRAGRSRLRRIVTVANLRPEKAHEILIEAVAALLKVCADVELFLVGGGPRLNDLKAVADRLGIASRVHFLGHREDVAAILADSDLFALTSRSEAFPNSVMEAMAAGLPIVATKVDGVPELIEHQRNGVLVAADDAGAVTAALRELIEHPGHAAALGLAARQTVESRFSFDRMVSSFEDLYVDLIQRRALRTAPTTEAIPS
jgi:glycosyltransferase involved in cell wall biosynthesis